MPEPPPPAPPHPVSALTTSELAYYRRRLENAIAYLDKQDPVPAARADVQSCPRRRASRAGRPRPARRRRPTADTREPGSSPAPVPRGPGTATRHPPGPAQVILVPNGPGSRPAASLLLTWPEAVPAPARKGRTVPMTGPPPASPPPAGDLPARLFRALYQGYDLHPAGGAWVAVPKGTACYAAPTIGEIARQISVREHPAPEPPAGVPGPGKRDERPGPVPAPARGGRPGPRRRRAGPRPDRPRHHRHHHRRRAENRRHLRHRRPDHLDRRHPALVHRRRPAPHLASRGHRRPRPPASPPSPAPGLTPDRPRPAGHHEP